MEYFTRGLFKMFVSTKKTIVPIGYHTAALLTHYQFNYFKALRRVSDVTLVCGDITISVVGQHGVLCEVK